MRLIGSIGFGVVMLSRFIWSMAVTRYMCIFLYIEREREREWRASE